MHDRNERGQVAPLLALFALGIGLACLALGRLGADAVDQARARTAADAAALAAAGAAGIDAPEPAARRLATANGATVASFEAAGGDVRVLVRTGNATASARARALGAPPANAVRPPRASVTALAPALQAALARANQLLGVPVPVTSGVRSAADQRRLWLARGTSRYPVAPPGSSMHEQGLAVDVPSTVAERLAPLATRTGLCRPYPTADPVHFELC